MEGAFEEVALRRLGDGAVAMEVAVPFAVLLVREDAVGVVECLLVHLQVLVIARGLVGVQTRQDGLALGPPELHVLGIVLRRETLAVTEVDHAAVLLVPAPFPGPVNDGRAHLHEVRIPAAALRDVQDEPARLHAVARVDDAPGESVDELTVGSHHFQDGPELRLHKVLLQLTDTLVDLLVQARVVGDLLQDVRHIDEHHRDGVPAGLEVELGRKESGLRKHPLDLLEQRHGLIGILGILGSQAVLRHRDGREALGEHVPALLYRLAVGRHRKIHVPVLVEAMRLDEVDGRRCRIQAFLAPELDRRQGSDIAPPALEPDGLRGVHQGSVAVQAGENAAVFLVQAILQPERKDVGDDVHADALPARTQILNLFSIHSLETIATLKEMDRLQLPLQLHLLLVGHIAERDPVGTEVQADELHDPLAAHDIAAEVADHVDDLLREVLQFAGLLQVTRRPGFANGDLLAAVVVGRSADAALGTAHRQGREIRLVLAVQHVELAACVQPALVVFVHALEGVLDAREVRDAPVHRLQEVQHGQERTVEGRDMIIVERQFRSGRGDGLAVLHELLDPADLRERRRHGPDAPGTDGSGVLRQFDGFPQAAAAHMDNHLEPGRHGGHPGLRQLFPLIRRKHVSLAGGTVDEHALEAVFREHRGIRRNGLQVDIPIGFHGGERCVDKTDDFFHLHSGLVFEKRGGGVCRRPFIESQFGINSPDSAGRFRSRDRR